MGIPSFYRWLVERYPKIVADAIEETPVVVNGVSVPINLSGKNPNGFEYDNLYLDMNGIIHPCFHPEGRPGPKSYGQVFQSIFKYLDKIFSVVRPRSLLYMAIDGVAPRAKMNQQRARRFRAAKDAADEASRMESQSEGKDLAFSKKIVEMDSNIITPGTEFMSLLSSALRYYIHLRVNSECGWRGIKVIISDASVPGEGEHKIMSYIRLQRNLPGYRPNTTHCLYGLDADLIMLALATHEVHFSVLREGVAKVNANDKSLRGRNGSSSRNIPQHKESQRDVYVENMEGYIVRQKFQFLHIWTLRDYLRHDLIIPNNKFKTDLERLIDDFVFMCIFVGNDFLPHVPSLEISEGAIDLLMAVYKKQFKTGGYLTNSFEINLKNVEDFVQALGSHEDEIFRKRTQVQREREIWFRGLSKNSSSKKTKCSKDQILDNANPITDQVKLGEEGCKERFYSQKFEAKTADDLEDIRRQAVQKYVEGICWVMQYYYQGVCSWQWFYPYHYAPFASDFCGIDKLEIQFTIGKPFKPFDQLMGVLPAARKLMLDSSSPILDFYPTDFELDMNGKRHSWQAICKLPFIEESRLLAEIAKVEHALTEDEKQRNSLGMDVLLMHKINPLAVRILNICNADKKRWPLDKVKHEINPKSSRGMNGYVYISTESMCPAEINPPVEDMATIVNNEVVSFFYEHPPFHPHIPRPPVGVHKPRTLIKENDVPPPPVLWHETAASRARAFLGRFVPKSISGRRLARLSHELIRNHLPVMPSESQVSTVAPLGEKEVNGGKENYITPVGQIHVLVGKEAVGGSENHIVAGPKKRRRKKAKKGGNSDAKCDMMKVDGGSDINFARIDENCENSVTQCHGMKADGGSDINGARIGEKKQDGDISVHYASVGLTPEAVGGSENNIITKSKKRKKGRKGKKSSENGVATTVTVGGQVADQGSEMNAATRNGCDGIKVDGGSEMNAVARIGDKKQDGYKSENHIVTGSKKRKRRDLRQLKIDRENAATVTVAGNAANNNQGGSEMKMVTNDGCDEIKVDGGSEMMKMATKDGCDEIKVDGGSDINVVKNASFDQIHVLVGKNAVGGSESNFITNSENGVATNVVVVTAGGKAAADQGLEMNTAAKDGCHVMAADGGSDINVVAIIDDKKQDGGSKNQVVVTESKKKRKCRRRKKNGVATTVVLQADKDSDRPTLAVGGKAAADQGSEMKTAAKDGCHGVVADGGSDINAAARIGDKKQDGDKSENHVVTESKKRKRGGPKKRKINSENAATVTVAGNAANNNQGGSEMKMVTNDGCDGIKVDGGSEMMKMATKDGCDEIKVDGGSGINVANNASFDHIHVLGGSGSNIITSSENGGATNVVVTAGGKAAADQGSEMNTAAKDGCNGMAGDCGSGNNVVAIIDDKKQDGDNSENHIIITESKKRKRGWMKRKINSENAATVTVAGNAAINNQGGSEMTNDGCDEINVVKNASFDQIHVLVGKNAVGGSESNIMTNSSNGGATNVVVVTAGGKAAADQGSEMNTAAKDGCNGMAAAGGSDINVVARIDDKKPDGGSKNTESKKRRKCRKRKNGVATTVVLEADKDSDHPTVAVGGKAADQGSDMNTTAKDGCIGMAADGGSDINAAARIGDKKQDGDKIENHIVDGGSEVTKMLTNDVCDEKVVDGGSDIINVVKNASFDQILVLVGKEAVGGSENVGATNVVTAGDN